MTVREGLQIDISGIPAENGKCRVETQLKIGFHLKGPHGGAVMDWKQLRLPRSLIAKEKHRMEKFNGRDKHLHDSEILTLDARLVCDHDRTKILECCDNCIGRERKRAHRRKESLKLPGPLASIPVFGAVNPKNAGASRADELNPPTPTDPIEYQKWERSRIMVFSSTEYVDISAGECMLPTRITCYCRHHNEKVGFRIQFTARDCIGNVLASVLTNPVMMMDDHKSGKRILPTQAKASTEHPAKYSIPIPTTPTSEPVSPHSMEPFKQTESDRIDIESDQDEIDLEAGYYTPHRIATNVMRIDNGLPMNVLTPLESARRMCSKRRADDHDNESMIDDMQQQQSFRRKTSHDIAHGSTFNSPALAFSALPSPSPFMPGSPFANDEESNAFTVSFAQAMAAPGALFGQHTAGMLSRHGSVQSFKEYAEQERFQADSVSMLESFTTLDESVSSASDGFMPSMLTMDHSAAPSTIGLISHASMVIPITATLPAASSDAFIPNPPSVDNFSSPIGEGATMPGGFEFPEMNSRFLNITQYQEAQTFQNQTMIQHRQQQLLLQLQQRIHQQQQADVKPDQWTPATSIAEKIFPFPSSRSPVSPTAKPSSSAFIQIPVSLPDNVEFEMKTEPMDLSGESEDVLQMSKRRGRQHKSMTIIPHAPTASGASSPMVSPKAPSTTMPPSPSPPPYLPPNVSSPGNADPLFGADSTSAAAATQFLLLHQRQQQQQQQLQTQLQQQHLHLQQLQKNALLPKQQTPRIQKIIPSKGPVAGGIEVTFLGSGFFPGIVPTFDGIPAVDVQFYGPGTVICRLPPRTFPGPVVVKAETCVPYTSSATGTNSNASSSSNELVRTISQFLGGSSAANLSVPNSEDDARVFFEYEEDKSDRDLIALALQVLGMKMSGRVEPPHHVAMRIMGTAAAEQQQLQEQKALMTQQNALVMTSVAAMSPAMARSNEITKTLKSIAAPPTSTPFQALTPIPLQSPQSLLLVQNHHQEQQKQTAMASFNTPSSMQGFHQQQQQQQHQQQQLQRPHFSLHGADQMDLYAWPKDQY